MKFIGHSATELEQTLVSLRARLEKSFGPDTAASGFRGTAPSTGHCAAVSAIAAELLGGGFASARVDGQSHWFNRVSVDDSQVDFDLTGDQFGLASVRVAPAGYLFEGTKERFFSELNAETLKRAVIVARRARFEAAADALQRALAQSDAPVVEEP